MLKLLDENKKQIVPLTNIEDYCIENILETGDKILSFAILNKLRSSKAIREELYIRNKENEYVIKSKEFDDKYTKVTCNLNVENLEGCQFDRYESIEQTITAALNLAIVGTGWTVKENNIIKKRTVRMTDCSSWDIVQEIRKVYRVDFIFNAIDKIIEVYNHLGSDKGTYLMDSLNLKSLNVQSDTYKFATRLKVQGKDGLKFSEINDGKDYVDNFQYSNKVKTLLWKDDRYTVKENLLEDAKAKLEEISKPFRSYTADILNLAKMNRKYKDILDFKLGDTITLISKKNKIKDKQRIVKIIEYPNDHKLDTVELANATLKFEDIQKEFQDTTDTVNNITTDNGTIDGSTIDGIETKQIEDFEANVIKVTNLKAVYAEIDTLKVIKADIQNLNAVTARIGTLESTKANITDLTSTNIKVSNLEANKANITDLNAASGKIHVLESKTASIDNLLAGNITAKNIATNAITAGSGIIADGAIGDAQISSLDVNKLNAGDITTSKHKIVSADGTIEIVGNQLLINRNNINRVTLGEYRKKDGTTDYGLVVRSKDGQTIMLDGNGVHNAGITDGAIDNNKVSDNANIAGNKLDINSVIREVNAKGTETIKGTKVTVGDRTLDVELSTQKNTITNNSKELTSQKASIKALDNAIKLKVDTQTYSNSISAINNNISTTNSNLSKATSELNVLREQVSSKVSQVDVDKSISEVKIGGRNLAMDSDKFNAGSGANGITSKIDSNGYLIVTTNSNNGNWFTYWAKTYDNIENNFNEGDPFTISFTVKAIGTKVLPTIYIKGGMGYYQLKGNLSEDFSTIYYSGIWKKSEDIRIHIGFAGITGTFTFKNWKIEKGTKATDWTPAPEDTDKLVVDNIKTVTEKITTAESNLIQKTDSIKASVQDLNSTTQTITTSVSNINRDLSNKINSNLDVAKNFATDMAASKANTAKQEAIIGARSIPDTRSNNESPSWYIEHYPKQLINEFKNAKVIGITGTTYGILETKIPWGDSSGGFPVQTFRSNNTPTYQRQGLNSTNWSEWEQIEDTKGSQDKANSALNNAKAFVNAEITTVNTKVHNLESGIDILKDKIDSKVSQSDIDKSITTVDNKIKLIDSKISDVSSNVIQLKDSVTTSINSINSKTHSIETTLGGKANKQEVTEVNNRVTTIKASLDGITQRVSSTEVTTNNLNGNISNLTSRMSSAEQKITPGAIINAVSNSINNGSQINTVSTTLDRNGLTVKNGAITIKNQRNRNVFWVDTTGQLCTDNIFIFGGEREANLDIRGTGNKGIGIRSEDGGDRYVDFSTLAQGVSFDTNARSGKFTRCVAKGGDFYIMPSKRLMINRVHPGAPTLEAIHADTNFLEVTGEIKSKVQVSAPKAHISKVFAYNTPNIDFMSPVFFSHDTQFGAKLKTNTVYHGSGSSNYPIEFGSPINMRGLAIYNANVGSDRRIKEDINYIDNSFKEECYNFIKDKYKAATFKYKKEIDDEQRERIGLIAQDLELDEIGELIKTKDKNGQLGYDNMNYTNVLAITLQESIKKIERLEEKLSELERKVTDE